MEPDSELPKQPVKDSKENKDLKEKEIDWRNSVKLNSITRSVIELL